MIRTARLAAGVTDAAGNPDLPYEVPDGYHVKLRGCVASVGTAVGQIRVLVVTPGLDVIDVLNVTPPALDVPQRCVDNVVLEAGDYVYVVAAVGSTCRYWLSGTVYTD